MRCRALVTGFDWYRGVGYTVFHPNPSSIVAEKLDGLAMDSCSVKGVVLDVDFNVLDKLWKFITGYEPNIVVGLGLSPRAAKPLLELSSVNLGFRIVDGERDLRILYGDSPNVLSIQVDFLDLLKHLWSRGYDIAPSNTTGLYLCNAVAYTIYKYGYEYEAYALFLHIPPVGDLRIRLGLDIRTEWSINQLTSLVKDIIEYLSMKLAMKT